MSIVILYNSNIVLITIYHLNNYEIYCEFVFVELLNKKMDIVGFVALPNIFYIANFKITRIEAPKIGLEMQFILICIIAKQY